MKLRKDALLAASKLVIAVNEVINGVPGSQVGTVGKIQAQPGGLQRRSRQRYLRFGNSRSLVG